MEQKFINMVVCFYQFLIRVQVEEEVHYAKEPAPIQNKLTWLPMFSQCKVDLSQFFYPKNCATFYEPLNN